MATPTASGPVTRKTLEAVKRLLAETDSDPSEVPYAGGTSDQPLEPVAEAVLPRRGRGR